MSAALGPKDYDAYIHSEAWRSVRRRFFESKLFKDKCWACKGPGPFDLHHRTYARLGKERLTDLFPLCHTCHVLVHRLRRQHSLSLFVATRKAKVHWRHRPTSRCTYCKVEGPE